MTKLSKRKVKEAIKGSKGIITAVANRCGVTRKQIYKYRDKYPDIREALQEERERLVDMAEKGLIINLDKQQPWAIGLVLKTLGRNRGYVEKLDVSGELNQPVVINIIKPKTEEKKE